MARRAGEPVTDAPPSRYRVVERGRRLVVIDNLTGQPATRDTPVRAAQSLMPARRPIEAAAPSGVDDRIGAAVLTTSRLYDAKGPRRIRLDDRLNKAVGGWVAALVIAATVLTVFFPFLWIGVLFALFQPKLRGGIRTWITAQLDKSDQAAS